MKTGKLKIDTTGKWSAKVANKRTWLAMQMIDGAYYDNDRQDQKSAAAELVETSQLTATKIRQLMECAQAIIADQYHKPYHPEAKVLLSALTQALTIQNRGDRLKEIGI